MGGVMGGVIMSCQLIHSSLTFPHHESHCVSARAPRNQQGTQSPEHWNNSKIFIFKLDLRQLTEMFVGRVSQEISIMLLTYIKSTGV